MSVEQVETSLVKTEQGPVRINANEFNPDLHELHEDDPKHPSQKNKKKQNAPQTVTDSNGVVRKPIEGNEAAPASMQDAELKTSERVAATQFGVVQDGKQFYVVDVHKTDAKGYPLRINDLTGIDPNGYASNKEAWDALQIVRTKATPSTTIAAPGGTTVEPPVDASAATSDVPMPGTAETPPAA